MHRKVIRTTGDIAELITKAREMSGKTLIEVSAKSGFTMQTISNLEKNRGSVNVNTLLAVAQTVGVSIEMNIISEDINNRDF